MTWQFYGTGGRLANKKPGFLEKPGFCAELLYLQQAKGLAIAQSCTKVLTRQGFKPLANSASPLKRTNIFYQST